MARHLRQQSGGDPTDQGPVPELANEPASPRSDDDFPDAPSGNRAPVGGGAGGAGDLSADQLDDFAGRLGLTDEQGGSSDASSGDEKRPRLRAWAGRLRRPVGRVLTFAGRGAASLGDRLRAAGDRLDAG